MMISQVSYSWALTVVARARVLYPRVDFSGLQPNEIAMRESLTAHYNQPLDCVRIKCHILHKSRVLLAYSDTSMDRLRERMLTWMDVGFKRGRRAQTMDCQIKALRASSVEM